MIKFFGVVALVLVFCLQLSFQAPTEQRFVQFYFILFCSNPNVLWQNTLFRDTKSQGLHDAVGSVNQAIDRSAILSRKRRQQQMNTFEAFDYCIKNVAKDGLDFNDYLLCKHASGVVFPDVAELKPVGYAATENEAATTGKDVGKVTRLESDDDTETVTSFDDYLKGREEVAKNQMRMRKNPKGFVLDEGEDEKS